MIKQWLIFTDIENLKVVSLIKPYFYFPWAFKILTATTNPQALFTKNETDVISNIHNVFLAAPLSITIILSLFFVGARVDADGFTCKLINISFAFTVRFELKNIIRKILNILSNFKK